MTTGERIKNARKAVGLTQKQLAEMCGIAEITIRQYESDKRIPKSKELTEKIAAALNVSGVYLLWGGESDCIKSAWESIQDNDAKRKELVIEILKTHNYKVEEKDIHWLIITNHQGFQFLVSKDDFTDMVERCDKDIRYNTEKLISESREIKK